MIEAPFTLEQVEQLQRFQGASYMHPFTCGNDHGGRRVLIATEAGWRRPQDCGYVQTWAHGFMADKDSIDLMQRSHERLFDGAS